MLVSVLEGLHEADDFVDVPSHGQVVDAVLAKSALLVNDVGCTERNTCVITVLDKAAIVLADLLGDVRDHWDAHGSEATLLSRLHRVLSVGEVRVNRAPDDLSVDGLELGALVIELADFSRAHKCEVQRPEEKHDILACQTIREKTVGSERVMKSASNLAYLPLNCSSLSF